MPAVVVNTGEVAIVTAPKRKVLKLTELIIENKATADANVVVSDAYKTVDGTDKSRDIVRITVKAGSSVVLSELEGQRILGTMKVTTDVYPLNVNYGVV